MTRPAPLASTPSTATPAISRAGGRRARTLAAGVAVAGLALVAGCSTMSPSQTQVPYQPADGVALSSGSVLARDLLIVASAKGATGVLSGSLINTGTSSITVSFAAAPTADAATAPPSSSVQLAPREQKLITTVEIPAVAAAPGALTALVMTTPDGDAVAQVPVLLPQLYYSSLTPTSTPTASTTAPNTASTSATSPAATGTSTSTSPGTATDTATTATPSGTTTAG